MPLVINNIGTARRATAAIGTNGKMFSIDDTAGGTIAPIATAAETHRHLQRTPQTNLASAGVRRHNN
jgi:hypothetical protein